MTFSTALQPTLRSPNFWILKINHFPWFPEIQWFSNKQEEEKGSTWSFLKLRCYLPAINGTLNTQNTATYSTLRKYFKHIKDNGTIKPMQPLSNYENYRIVAILTWKDLISQLFQKQFKGDTTSDNFVEGLD